MDDAAEDIALQRPAIVEATEREANDTAEQDHEKSVPNEQTPLVMDQPTRCHTCSIPTPLLT
jgi:hypothetical protein